MLCPSSVENIYAELAYDDLIHRSIRIPFHNPRIRSAGFVGEYPSHPCVYIYCHNGHTDSGSYGCDRRAQRERQIAYSDGKDCKMDGCYFHVESALLGFVMLYRICRKLDALLVGVNLSLASRKTNG
jgi:hypothetical protein